MKLQPEHWLVAVKYSCTVCEPLEKSICNALETEMVVLLFILRPQTVFVLVDHILTFLLSV